MKRQQTGKLAETIAGQFLERQGFTIVERNWRCPEGEIDIVCSKDDQFVFVEVRSKSSDGFGTPAESVTRRKQAKLIAAAERYAADKPGCADNWRIDFIGITFNSGRHQLEHVPYAISGD